MFLRAGLFHLHVQDRKAGVRSSPRLEDHGQKRDGSLLCGYICQSEVSLLKAKQEWSSQRLNSDCEVRRWGTAERYSSELLGKLGSHTSATTETYHGAGATLLTAVQGERGQGKAQALSNIPVPLHSFPSTFMPRQCILIQSVPQAT